MNQELQSEVMRLREEVSRQSVALERKDGEITRLTQETELLRQKIDALSRRLFGVSSEKLDPKQLQLLLKGMEEDTPGKSESAAGQDVLEDETSSPFQAS